LTKPINIRREKPRASISRSVTPSDLLASISSARRAFGLRRRFRGGGAMLGARADSKPRRQSEAADQNQGDGGKHAQCESGDRPRHSDRCQRQDKRGAGKYRQDPHRTSFRRRAASMPEMIPSFGIVRRERDFVSNSLIQRLSMDGRSRRVLAVVLDQVERIQDRGPRSFAPAQLLEVMTNRLAPEPPPRRRSRSFGPRSLSRRPRQTATKHLGPCRSSSESRAGTA
jgi:hypothetical protein